MRPGFRSGEIVSDTACESPGRKIFLFAISGECTLAADLRAATISKGREGATVARIGARITGMRARQGNDRGEFPLRNHMDKR